MFYTVTLNPAVDYIVRPTVLTLGQTCRSEREELRVGGKGINVSLVLAALSTPSVATGFLAGFTGVWLVQNLQNEFVTPDFVCLPEGKTRINVKIKGEKETEINASGPAVKEEDLALLLKKFDALRDGDTLILAGNLPKGCPADFYKRVLQSVSGKHIRAAVDTSGACLRDLLSSRPFLIKPNRQELSELFGTRIFDLNEVEESARQLQTEGARNVLVSLGGDGSFLLDETGQTHRLPGLKGNAENTVGAGDSMVAGFLTGYEKTRDFAHAFLLSNACGAATAFSPWLAGKQQIEECLATFKK